MNPPHRVIVTTTALLVFTVISAQGQEWLAPYEGPSVEDVDTSTLTDKVMCGYQGWFACEGDGADRGWVHWTKGGGTLSPENANIDLWPDVSEYGPEERYDTAFRHDDGRVAQVFSSFDRETVLRHFAWMREYGIDGAFVQRFAVSLRGGNVTEHRNAVLSHCREGANRNGRAYAVMYDLSGMRAGQMQQVMDDWRMLRAQMDITGDPAYLRHRDKPLVAVWGIGFNDGRDYTVEECRGLLQFLKDDGCTVMVGVPTYWRTQRRDAVADPALHEVLALADVLSPWSVGRYRSPEEAARLGNNVWERDLEWCESRGIDFLPVIFPGFSWHNMKGDPLDAIPRRKGAFFWSQVGAAMRAGAGMLYVAMFDEVDEGTAIFKCTNDPPAGGGVRFLTYEGLPSDFYLRLTGAAGEVLRGARAWTPGHPQTLAGQSP